MIASQQERIVHKNVAHREFFLHHLPHQKHDRGRILEVLVLVPAPWYEWSDQLFSTKGGNRLDFQHTKLTF